METKTGVAGGSHPVNSFTLICKCSGADKRIGEIIKDNNVKFEASAGEGFSEEEFGGNKSVYEKKALQDKKNGFLENWLRGLEFASKLNIDLANYEKYYQ